MTPQQAQDAAALARRRLALVHAVPEECPADHLRNAIQLLVAHENAHPAVWTFSPELRACEARLFKALYQIEGKAS